MKRRGSLRRQLIIGISLVHAILMTVFVIDLVGRQQSFINQESIRLSEALAKVMASNSDTWLLSRDYSGLQEIMESQKKIPNVTMAMVFSPDGKILAHSDPNRVGRFIANSDQPQLFSSDAEGVITFESDEQISVVAPIIANGTVLGKVWLDLSRENFNSSLHSVARDGVIYIILAIIIGILIAWVIVGAATKRLNHLVTVAESVRLGDRKTRVQVSGEDEIGQLGRAFDLMLDSLQQEERSLELANEKANLANRTKSEFLANMSHEIRTPINAMVGSADVLADTNLSVEQRTYVGMFQRACDTLLNLVNDILDFSKIEAGEFRIVNNPFFLEELLTDIVALNKEVALGKGLNLELKHDAQIPSQLVGDAYRIRQIIQNLVSNAVKFSERGTITIFAQLKENVVHTDKRVSCLVTIGVEDQGVGIPETERNKLFERFQQVDSSATRKVRGTGLGLAISKRLVDIMGGAIHCESQLGTGSRFYFWLPFLCAPINAESSSAVRKSTVNLVEVNSKNKRKKILLVDDAEDNRMLVRAFLKDAEVELEEAENGEVALLKFKETKYDLVLLDLQMPVMDGYETVKLMRRWEFDAHRERSRIFALSADSITEYVNRALVLGCDNHIAKPVRKKTLLDVIAKL